MRTLTKVPHLERVRDDEYIGAKHGGANKNDEPFQSDQSEKKSMMNIDG